MKLLSLNTWGATQGGVFFDYIKQQAKDTDIFCFQEIFSAPPAAPEVSSGARMRQFEELAEILVDFKGFFCQRSRGYDFKGKVDFEVSHGLASFIRKSIKASANSIVDIGQPVLNPADPVEGITKAQVIILEAGEKQFSIINYHGWGLPGDKLDTPERIRNSEALKVVWQSLPGRAKILCGDFNLMPETQSVKILDGCGKNLIKEFKISNTRNEVSWNIFKNKQYFADYTFVSPEVKVNEFQVPYNLVSDHLPMILKFDL